MDLKKTDCALLGYALSNSSTGDISWVFTFITIRISPLSSCDKSTHWAQIFSTKPAYVPFFNFASNALQRESVNLRSEMCRLLKVMRNGVISCPAYPDMLRILCQTIVLCKVTLYWPPNIMSESIGCDLHSKFTWS